MELEDERRLRVFMLVSAATVLIGIPFVLQYWWLGVPLMSVALLATIACGIANMLWVRRTLRIRVGGAIGTTLLLVLLVLSNVCSGGFYDPNFAWLYVIPVYAALMVDARAGWVFTGVVIVLTLGFWFAPSLGVTIPNFIPPELHSAQSLANRLSAILGIAIALGALASQQTFARSRLEAINNELRAEMERSQQAQEQLVRSERLASMGTLAAGVGHEINNPLACVIANLQFADRVLCDEGDINHSLRETLDDALDGALRVKRLVRDLKTFARDDGGTSARVSLRTSVDNALRILAHELRLRAQLAVDVDESLWVEADPRRLEQVLVNLISNALQALPSGQASQNRIAVAARVRDEWVELLVMDTGSGIAGKHREDVFEPYFTTKGPENTGMGLSISRNLVEGFGGRLELEESGSAGTTFRVEMRRATAASSTNEAVGEGEATPRARILIVDDEVELLRSLKRLLSHHTVEIESTVSRGLRRVATEPFDLILCDLMMPDGDGSAFHQALSQEHPQLLPKLVFISGGAYGEGLKDFALDADIELLEKPFDSEHVDELVRARVSVGSAGAKTG